MDHVDTVLPGILSRRAAHTPEQVFVREVGGGALTFAELETLVGHWMCTLRVAGVGPGAPVIVMLPVSFDAIAVWLALARVGAVQVAINTGYVGNLLRHVVTDSAAETLVIHSNYADRFAALAGDIPLVRQAILIGDSASAPALSFVTLPLQTDHAETGTVLLGPHDIASVIYTSGTTGPSKGVLVTWRQTYETSRWCLPPEDLKPDDVWYSPWPYYHVSGQLGLVSAAVTGTGLVIRETFSTSAFWDDVRAFNCTTVLLPGATLAYLENLPVGPKDRIHPLRNVLAAPLPRNTTELADRFGIRFRTMFNMTEISCPIVSGWTLGVVGSCGTVRSGAACRIVDDYDEEVPVGDVGELVVRSDRPWELMAGYLNRPDATIAAWRNLWFHTGDAFRKDTEGNFYFVDRLKHTIRKGGENISSVELESEVSSYGPVAECAAIGVPSSLGEEEVKVFVVAKPGQEVEPAALIDFLMTRVPRFMIPRYVVLLDEIPKTNTHRARKEELRKLEDYHVVWDLLATDSRLSARIGSDRR